MSALRKPDFTKLISIESYVDIDHATPYTYTVQNDERSVTIFGADHSNNNEHKQFPELEKIFLKQQPHCVLLEGIQDEITFTHLHTLIDKMQPEEAIVRGGESVYAAHLATEAGITWQSVEPEDGDLFRYIESLGFTRDDIVVWAIMRLLPQYLRRNETISFFEYAEPFQAQIENVTGWSEATQLVEKVVEKAKNIVGAEINLVNEERAIGYTTPLAVTEHDCDYTVINTIAATAVAYRDRAMIESICKALNEFRSVFVVYGASHAVMQEKALHGVFGKN